MPQVKKAIHWTQVLFELRGKYRDGQMVERELAELYKITPQHPDFQNAVEICVRQKKVARVLGLKETRGLGILLVLIEDTPPKE